MPDLSKLVNHFGTYVTGAGGRRIRVQFRKLRSSRSYNFDAEFIPRHSIGSSPDQNIQTGELITDTSGNQFLCVQWSDQHLRNQLVEIEYVLFEVNANMVWTRPQSTPEPISGLALPANSQQLGIVPASKQPFRKIEDALKIEQMVYSVLCAQPVQVGDFLDGMRVRRIEVNLGLTFAQIL